MPDFPGTISELPSIEGVESLPLADIEVLRQRADDLGRDEIDDPLLKSLVSTFIEDAQDAVPNLRRDAVENNVDAVQETAHRLKGGAATVGAKAFESLCRTIERAAKQDRTAEVRRGAEELSVILERTVEKFRRLLGTLSSHAS